jgi:hypothetical protein
VRVRDTEIKIAGRFLRVARLDAEKFQFLEEEPDRVVEGLRGSGVRIDLFTFLQKLSDPKPDLAYPMEMDNFAAIPISTFENWWTKQIGFKARNKAKQAEKKGVALREVPFSDGLVHGIWKIYNECPIRQGRRFSHYGKDLQRVHQDEATYLDKSVFIGAFLGDELIGFIKMVWDESRTQAGLMNIVSLIKERDKAPSNALVAHAVKACASRGISYLTYSNFSYGKKQSDSLSDFKERNGFQRFEVARYFVPLTPLGNLALRFGLHHRLSERIPESLAEKLRELREAWYKRKFPTLTEAS